MAGMKAVENGHEKAYKEIDATSRAKTHKTTLKNETKAIKEEIKVKTEQIVAEERVLDLERMEMIALEERYRQLTQLIRDHNRGEPIGQPIPVSNKNDLEALTRDIENLTNTRKVGEDKYDRVFKKMNDNIREAEGESKIMSIKLKEKEQECKICDMKIKELNRSMPHKSLRPIGLKYRNVQSKVKATTFYSSGLGYSKKPFQSTGMTTITTSVSHKNRNILPSSLKAKSKPTPPNSLI
jgi:hypothetical protein